MLSTQYVASPVASSSHRLVPRLLAIPSPLRIGRNYYFTAEQTETTQCKVIQAERSFTSLYCLFVKSYENLDTALWRGSQRSLGPKKLILYFRRKVPLWRYMRLFQTHKALEL